MLFITFLQEHFHIPSLNLCFKDVDHLWNRKGPKARIGGTNHPLLIPLSPDREPRDVQLERWMFLSQIFSAPINLNIQTRLISCNSHISLDHCLHLLWTTFDFCALLLMCFWVSIWSFSHAFRKVSDTSGLGATVTLEVFPQFYSVQTPSSQGTGELLCHGPSLSYCCTDWVSVNWVSSLRMITFVWEWSICA